MNIEIKMLNVKDGDAIIVFLYKEGQTLLMLIDAGHVGDATRVKKELDIFLKKLNKKAPDVIVCTHYDNDHIGGLKEIISFYGKDIGVVWMHKTSSIIELVNEYTHQKDTVSILPSEDDFYLTDGININDQDFQIVLENLKQEVALIRQLELLSITIKEPIAGHCSIDDWAEIQVIGPTMVYYKRLFPDHFDREKFLKEEVEALSSELISAEHSLGDPYLFLDNLPKSLVTNPNLNSAIILITVKNHKYLFTGDAGIESFYEIPHYQEVLRNIYWLKVPHHASKNNLNSEIIKLLSPVYAFISGNKHISQAVLDCFRACGSKIKTTKESNDDLEFYE